MSSPSGSTRLAVEQRTGPWSTATASRAVSIGTGSTSRIASQTLLASGKMSRLGEEAVALPGPRTTWSVPRNGSDEPKVVRIEGMPIGESGSGSGSGSSGMSGS
jgi:hypothetical protein